METIHVEERRLLLKALRRVRITDPSVLTGGPEPATPAQLDELEMVLADDQLRLIVKPEEQTFELQLSVTVLATSREEAKAAISTAIEEGREMLDEQLVDWRVTGVVPIQRAPTARPVLTPDGAGLMAQILEEASRILHALPEPVAEKLQVRCFLPDELDGSAGMLRDHFGVAKPTKKETAPPAPIAVPMASNTAIPGRRPECSLLRNERGEASPRTCAICGLGPCQQPGRQRPPIEPLSFDPGANWSPLR